VNPRPTITSAKRSVFAVGGAGSVTFVGTGFEAVASLKLFSGTTVEGLTKWTVTHSTITGSLAIPVNAPLGAYTVMVINPDGGSGTCASCLSVIAAPTVTGISPSSAAPGTVISVTLTGSGFGPGATIAGPSGVSYSQMTVQNSTTITATIERVCDCEGRDEPSSHCLQQRCSWLRQGHR
jgi:hypothetical protein